MRDFLFHTGQNGGKSLLVEEDVIRLEALIVIVSLVGGIGHLEKKSLLIYFGQEVIAAPTACPSSSLS